jgi:two-component system OmpR family response regulator
MKLLIVDDHAGVRTLIRQLATPIAIEVRECGNGAEALRIARQFSPEVVTMDVRLPDLNGIEVLRTLHVEFSATRFIVVTAHDQPELRTAALAAGAVCFLPKDNLFELPALLAHWDTLPATPLTPREEG